MTDDSSDIPPPARGAGLGLYLRLTAGFWRGKTAGFAWFLTLASVVVIGLTIAVQFGLTQWNRYFFDALAEKDGPAVMIAIVVFVMLLAASSLIAMAGVVARMRLQVGWRQWLTMRLTRQWLGEQRFYRLSVAAPDLDAP